MRVGILGSGLMGGKLGTLVARAVDEAAFRCELIRDVGCDPRDAGALRIARYAEPVALRVAQRAYGGEGGPGLAHRVERLRIQEI